MNRGKEARESALAARVLDLYREGWFPMGEGRDGPTQWLQPEQRSVLELAVGQFHVPKSLASRVRSGRFEIRADTVFERVIRACAEERRRAETADEEVHADDEDDDSWINPEIIELYTALARAGIAHSVEAWRDGVLVGGLYGVAVGGVFCGESMFSRPAEGGTDASKVCLVHLVGHLRARGFQILDAQIANPHTATFGFRERPASWYVRRVRELAATGSGWGTFEAGETLRSVPEAGARYTPP